MRGRLCRKQTFTVIVIHYCTEDRQLLIALQSAAVIDPIARDICQESRFSPTPPAFGAPLGSPHQNIAVRFGMEKKTTMVDLPGGEKSFRICLFVSTEYTNVTDGGTL